MANGGTRLLIATGAVAGSRAELPPLVQTLIAGASDLLVMTPILTSRLEWLASDTDRARFEADERLASVLSHVEELAPGANVSAQVGDETPLTAFADAIRDFAPDHILVALRSADEQAWEERHLIDDLRRAFRIPITVFALG